MIEVRYLGQSDQIVSIRMSAQEALGLKALCGLCCSPNFMTQPGRANDIAYQLYTHLDKIIESDERGIFGVDRGVVNQRRIIIEEIRFTKEVCDLFGIPYVEVERLELPPTTPPPPQVPTYRTGEINPYESPIRYNAIIPPPNIPFSFITTPATTTNNPYTSRNLYCVECTQVRLHAQVMDMIDTHRCVVCGNLTRLDDDVEDEREQDSYF